MKEKALILNVSKWEIDGNRGGKLTYCTFTKVQNDNRCGVDILTSACPPETLFELPSVPCVAELELSLSAAVVNGKAITKVNITGVKPVEEKTFSGNCCKVSLT